MASAMMDKGPLEVLRALLSGTEEEQREALVFQRESFRAKWGCYPDELTSVRVDMDLTPPPGTQGGVDFNDTQPDGTIETLRDYMIPAIEVGQDVVVGDHEGNRCHATVGWVGGLLVRLHLWDYGMWTEGEVDPDEPKNS